MERVDVAEVRSNIGWLIRKKRIEKNISQSQLAKRANISRVFVNLIENGRRLPSYETLGAIASGLDEDVMTLLAEAKLENVNPEIKLAHLLSRLVKSNDEKKMRKLLKFVEMLS
jgi:transcriptional regulator with XRE-family HTH domain